MTNILIKELTAKLKLMSADLINVTEKISSHQKVEPLSSNEIRLLGLWENLLSFLLEDFVEIGLQYFYFEKYTFLPGDTFVYFKPIFMILKAVEYSIRTMNFLKEAWNDFDVKEWFNEILSMLLLK